MKYVTAEAVLCGNDLQLSQQEWKSSKPYAQSPRMCLGLASQPDDLNDDLTKFETFFPMPVGGYSWHEYIAFAVTMNWWCLSNKFP